MSGFTGGGKGWAATSFKGMAATGFGGDGMSSCHLNDDAGSGCDLLDNFFLLDSLEYNEAKPSIEATPEEEVD